MGMMKTYNAKTLVKFIRNEKKEKGHLVWQESNGMHYISNRIWAVRTAELEKAVLKELLDIFGERPNGRVLVYQFDGVYEKSTNQINVEAIYVEPVNKGKVTPVALANMGGGFTRMIEFDNGQIVWINNDYLKLLCKGVNKCKLLKNYAVQFGEDVVIMPLKPETFTEALKKYLRKFFEKGWCLA